MRINILILLLLSVVSVISFASGSFKIGKLEVEGFTRTDDSVIFREIELKSGDMVDKERLEFAITRLENTQIFYELSCRVKGKGKVRDVIFKGKDRWTTIPILKFSSGGGISQTTVGVFDPNILGKYFMLGAQYERLGDSNSGVAWYKNEWFSDQRLTTDLQVWKQNRVRIKYDNDEDNAVETGGFLHSRTKVKLDLSKELNYNWRLGLNLEYHDDQFSEDTLSNKIKTINSTRNQVPSLTTFHFGIHTTVGNIKNKKNYLVDGFSLRLDLNHAIVRDTRVPNFSSLLLTGLYYKTLFWDSTFAARVIFGLTDTKAEQYRFYIGGFDGIRGFYDGRFSATQYWLSNTEFRLPVVKIDWLVVQGSTFFDVIASGDEFSSLGSINAASLGGGLRFIFPKIFRFVARVDYAKSIVKEGSSQISFGVQQFY